FDLSFPHNNHTFSSVHLYIFFFSSLPMNMLLNLRNINVYLLSILTALLVTKIPLKMSLLVIMTAESRDTIEYLSFF
ncbi:hypothetical protein L9F63_018141, partial [Diploptera punctata]